MIQLELPTIIEVEDENDGLQIEEVSTTFFINPLVSLTVFENNENNNNCVLTIDDIEYSIALPKMAVVALLEIAYGNFNKKITQNEH